MASHYNLLHTTINTYTMHNWIRAIFADTQNSIYMYFLFNRGVIVNTCNLNGFVLCGCFGRGRHDIFSIKQVMNHFVQGALLALCDTAQKYFAKDFVALEVNRAHTPKRRICQENIMSI